MSMKASQENQSAFAPGSLPSSTPWREPKLDPDPTADPTAEAFRNCPSLTRPWGGGGQVQPWQLHSPSQSNVLQGEAGSHTARSSGRGRRGSFYRHRRGSGERPSAGGGGEERGVFSLGSTGKRNHSLRSSPRPRWLGLWPAGSPRNPKKLGFTDGAVQPDPCYVSKSAGARVSVAKL